MTIPPVVGVDGSAASLEAVDWAADEAVRHGVPLPLLHAVTGGHEASDVIGAAAERARKGAPGVRLSSEVPHGDATAAVLGEGRNAFAPVPGSRGPGDLAGTLPGSVGLAVAARADCPVAVVRGAPVGRRVIEGPARRALPEADPLVVGVRRRQGHPGPRLGLIKHAVPHHAPCPVAVVPGYDRTGGDGPRRRPAPVDPEAVPHRDLRPCDRSPSRSHDGTRTVGERTGDLLEAES
ncbi:hypothetical protein GCM10019016_018080 [Streptomyces prasinosporus]|uniref:UspA domain-containing protein n=1 Tax=Streptomyces prasinosporus TaxID=68256 RepID=A0ABP6TIZ8_9ACTN